MLILIALLMILSPGPDFAVVVKNSLTYGRTSALYASIGIGLANVLHVTVNLLGLGIILAKSIVIFTLMKMLGAAYLIYLGYQGLKAKQVVSHSFIPETKHSLSGKKKGFYSGFLTSLLNPKACLFYLSFFSVLLSPHTKIMTQIFYGLGLSTLALLWFVLVSLFFTHPIMSQKIQGGKHWLERFTGGILIVLGLKLLSSEILK